MQVNENNVMIGLLDKQVAVHIPIENTTSSSIIAEILLEIIDFQDRVQGVVEINSLLKQGINSCDLTVLVSISGQDVFSSRLHYRVTTKEDAIEGFIGLNVLSRQIEMQLIGSRDFYANSPVSFRVFVRDFKSKEPVVNAITTGFLIQQDDTSWVCDGLTDKDGMAELSFFAPDSTGSYELRIKTSAPFAVDEITERITVKSGNQVYLVTDKPIYQPNQTIFMRALALTRFHLTPVPGTDTKIQVYDDRNNRVFKSVAKTDSFGVFFADFQLADEINFGNYKIEAVVGNDIQSKTVEVKPYVLPKFKLSLTTDNEYYQPGSTVKGKINADYFFGKPVAGCKIVIKASKYDVSWSQFTELKGTTDKKGVFEFSLKLPSYFVGQPFEQGQARVRLEVSVVDNADHEEKTSKSIIVTKDDLVITVIPESDIMLPESKNTVFIITTYPDGSPAKVELNIKPKKGKVSKNSFFTDRLGLAEISVTPDKNGMISLALEAFDIAGNRTSTSYESDAAARHKGSLKMVADRSIYKTGDIMQLSIYSPGKQSPVFIDVIKQGQVIGSLTRDITDSPTKIELSLSSDYNGLLQISAYLVNKSGQITRDFKTVFVDPVSDLLISATPDKKSYLPGAEAVVRFAVKDRNHDPVVTSLGISIVDEAVFALSEMQPGLEKVYFMLEQEILTPRYEIHGYEPSDIVRFESEKYNYNEEDIRSREQAGKILFSQVSRIMANQLDDNTGKSKRNNDFDVLNKARPRVAADASDIAKLLLAYPWNKKKTLKKKDIEKALASINMEKFHDPWGNRYRNQIEKSKSDWHVILKSAGPDEVFSTDDDMRSIMIQIINNENKEKETVAAIHSQGEIYEVYNDKPSAKGKITGFVVDAASNEPLIGANVIIDGTERGAATNEQGKFVILDVPPGHYNIVCSYLGYDPYSILGVPVLAGKRTELRYCMRPTTIQVEGVTSIATRPTIVVSATQSGRSVTSQDIKRLPVTAINQVVAVEEPRVRKYFPETFLFEPSLITDNNGEANLTFLMPDNITTWRMSMMGSDKNGRLGSNTYPLLVFKDFFIDLDLPVSLTCGDEISLPVAVYNYLKETMTIRIELTEEDWFELLDTSVKEIEIEKENVGVVYFRIKALEFGEQKLLVKAYTKSSSDAIQKKVKVLPNGKHENQIVSGRLTKDIEHTVNFSGGTIPGTQKILVRFYPGILSQLVDGLDGLLQMPFGCFEQTTSVTYPNVLMLDYLRKSDKRKPEIEIKALEYISIGYQRLLSYETSSGGFSWWGSAPGNRLLTAYGLMEFHDMKQVFDLDEKIIERTIQWFLRQQEKNGSWSLDPSYLHEEVWGKFKNAEILPTAFITWALLEAGYKGKEIDKAMDYLKRYCSYVDDPYALSLVANAYALYDPKDDNLHSLLSKLISQKAEEEGKIYWSSGISSITNSHGSGANIETSSLIALALLRADQYPDIAAKVINYLNANRSPNGGWSTTQGTVFALKAIMASAKIQTEKISATINIINNGGKVGEIAVTPEQSDVMHMVEIKDNVELVNNTLRLEIRGKGSLLYDIVSDYYLDWQQVPAPTTPALAIAQDYDKTRLNKDDVVTCTVSAANESNMNFQMVIVDLGIPPGFDVIENDLADLVTKKVFQKYHLTLRQIILYFDKIPASDEIKFVYHIKARFPLRAKTSYSRIYDYYNPDKSGLAKPVEFEVSEKK